MLSKVLFPTFLAVVLAFTGSWRSLVIIMFNKWWLERAFARSALSAYGPLECESFLCLTARNMCAYTIYLIQFSLPFALAEPFRCAIIANYFTTKVKVLITKITAKSSVVHEMLRTKVNRASPRQPTGGKKKKNRYSVEKCVSRQCFGSFFENKHFYSLPFFFFVHSCCGQLLTKNE